MVDKKNKADSIVRRALWNTYNKKCFYCNNPIQFNNFNVDHIIPESMGDEEAIKLYDLQEDFELNSYLNLVPTCFVCNSKKSNKKFEKQHILFYLNLTKQALLKITELERKFREKDKVSEISAVFNTAQEELKLPEILNVLKDQQLTPFQKKILESSIQTISRMDIDNVIKKIFESKSTDLDIALSVLAVIEPMDYNMADLNLFYNNFGFVFWSTSEMLRQKVEKGTTSFLNKTTKMLLINVDLDQVISELKLLIEKPRSDYLYFFETIQQFLNIILFTTQDGRMIHAIPFSTEFKKTPLYWFYVGSQDLESSDVIRKHNEKRDKWLDRELLGLKNSYVIISSEI